MRKILLSAAALAAFLNASPANAFSFGSGSKTQMITTFGDNYAASFANASTYANNIKNLLPQLLAAVQSEGVLTGSDLKKLQDAIKEKTFGTSGDIMKYIKKLAELCENLKNAKSVSTLATRVQEIEKNGRKTNALAMFQDILARVMQNPSLYPQTSGILGQISSEAANAVNYLNPIITAARDTSTEVYPYAVTLLNEYSAIAQSSQGNPAVFSGTGVTASQGVTKPGLPNIAPNPISNPSSPVMSPTTFPPVLTPTTQTTPQVKRKRYKKK